MHVSLTFRGNDNHPTEIVRSANNDSIGLVRRFSYVQDFCKGQVLPLFAVPSACTSQGSICASFRRAFEGRVLA